MLLIRDCQGVRQLERRGRENRIRRGWGRSHQVGPQLLAGGDDLSLHDEVDLLIDRLGLTDVADVRAGQLPTGQARLVEIARALAIRPRVLLLDEPASGLDDAESVQLGELMVQLAGSGLGILLVEHDVSLVMRVCSHVYVLDFGSVIDHGTAEHVQQSVVVRDAYLGSSV